MLFRLGWDMVTKMTVDDASLYALSIHQEKRSALQGIATDLHLVHIFFRTESCTLTLGTMCAWVDLVCIHPAVSSFFVQSGDRSI